MADPQPRPLADLLFGPGQPESCKPDEELAKLISAWFRAQQTQLCSGANFGTPSAKPLIRPRQP